MNTLLDDIRKDVFNKKYDFKKFINIIALITTFMHTKQNEDIFALEVYAKDIKDFYANTEIFENDLVFLCKMLIYDFTDEEICETMSNIYWQNNKTWKDDKKVIFYILLRGFLDIKNAENVYKTSITLSSLFLDTTELEEMEDIIYQKVEEDYKLFVFKKEYGKDLNQISFVFTSASDSYDFKKEENKKIRKVESYLQHITKNDLHKLLHNTNSKDIENIFFVLNLEAKRKIYNDRTDKFAKNLEVVERTKTFPEKKSILESCDNILNVLDNF